MAFIDVFNKAVSSTINKEGDFYTVLVGSTDFTPDIVVDSSDDINCGALCNELEYARLVSNYYVQSLALETAESGNLEDLIFTFINLPRNNQAESDTVFRNRFRFIVNQRANPRRTTRGAIIDALSHFLVDTDIIQIVEPFSMNNLYFQVRLEGVVSVVDSLFINSLTQGFIDQNFISGPGIGEVISYVGLLIERIKAAGVDFDILFIDQDSVTLDSDCIIGTVQMYLDSDALVLLVGSMTLNSDAVVV